MLINQPMELADHVVVTSAGEVGVDRKLGRAQPELLESTDLRGSERLLGHVRQRSAPPERKRLAGSTGLRAGARRGVDQPLKAFRVNHVGRHAQFVAAPVGNDLRASTRSARRS